MQTKSDTQINSWIYGGVWHKLTSRGQFSSLSFILFSHKWERRIVFVGAVSLITEMRACVRTSGVRDVAEPTWEGGCSSCPQTSTILTAPVTWLHTNVLAWRISAPPPPHSSTPLSLSLSLFSYLPSHLAPHCWSGEMAASCSCYNPPTASAMAKTHKNLSQWLVKKGKEHFAFALTIKPWQQSAVSIFLCFQFTLLLLL